MSNLGTIGQKDNKDRCNYINLGKEFMSISEYIQQEVVAPNKFQEKNIQLETNVLFVGERSSGKTSLINLCLGHKVPTVAPAFRYAHQKDKIKVNIWEMGHVVNEDIAAIPFMDKDQKRFVIVIVLDLSKPENVIVALMEWLNFLHVVTSSQKGVVGREDTNAHGSETRYEKVRILPYSTMIVGNKYDVFRNMESFKQKVACTALRYFTLLTKSCLVFSSTKDKRSRDNFKKVARACFFYSEIERKNFSNPWTMVLDKSDGKMPMQNIDQKTGPLLIYPVQNHKDERNALNDIKSTLPSKISDLYNSDIVCKHELFYSSQEMNMSKVVDKWIYLFQNIFGGNDFHLDNEKVKKDVKERLLLYPHDDIDALKKEADEESERLRRRNK